MTTILAFLALFASILSPSAPQDALPECDSRSTVLQSCYWTESKHDVDLDSDFWVDANFNSHWIDSSKDTGRFDYTNQFITPGVGFTACQDESSEGPCYWDALVRGNGEGRSFTVTADQEVLYW